MTTHEFDIRIVSLSPRIFRFALRITGNPAQADDVVQDVLEKMWRKRRLIAHCRDLEAFVMSATRNRCYDTIRHCSVVRSYETYALHQASQQAAENPAERLETVELVHRAIDMLPRRQRDAIYLRDIEGYEFDRIAHIMRCRQDNVRVYLSRARKAVAEILKEHR